MGGCSCSTSFSRCASGPGSGAPSRCATRLPSGGATRPLMHLWAWIRGVIADRGEHEPVPIFLERGEDDQYVYRLGVRAGFGGQETARLPVQRRPNPSPHPILKEIHVCEVAGQTLEAANLYSLQAKVARQLETLAPGLSLPLCYFRVAAMDYE